jgi:4-amino-4-deoxy-L-arabinose transferase-like glycosyltransferase
MNRSLPAALTMCTLLLAALIISANIVAATYGLDNISMVQAFNLDEARYLAKMKVSLEQFSLDPDLFYSYGNLYDSLCYYWIAFFRRFDWTINTHLVGFVLRLVSIISGALAGFSLWMFGEICGLPRAVAAAAALSLLTMPDFVVFSRMMHPDTLQTFFVIVALGAALARPTFSLALVAAAAAGAAFSTKYVGAIVLPFCFLPLALSTIGREQLSRQVLVRLYLQGLAMIAIFVAVFALTNPYAVTDFNSFKDGFIRQLNYSAAGHGVAEPANPVLWWRPLTAEFGVAGVLYLLCGFLLACVILFRGIRRVGWRTACTRSDLRGEFVLLLYILATSAHLAISIHEREPRFTYHVVPFLIVLSTLAFFRLIVALAKQIFPPSRVAAAFASLLLIFAWMQIDFDLRGMASASAKPASGVITFGNFVAQHYPSDIRILADAYTYLPPSMTNVTYTNLQTEELFRKVAPDAVIITRGATGSYVWKQPGTAFSDGKFVKDGRYAATPQVEIYLNNLLSKSSGWSVVREDATEVLFQHNR